ncbi:nucleotide-diphospho-sugar transferase-domain-containing protein [Dunaliella salina]|uniref:Nucleotide-diphospho-sugar transferase-domain-containing protein n=1 Tax=Dunaliella salina TaxID=3046 RepID=A0ABQ7G5Y6_DUNSA|nr:nucleotide-diphospho-sugar transferase-domain-containing protein [Dunaliella salina]|eukprot:KAF5830027.1 nucleotide-diphospho-sugar transferase-domain-containing protein [Dunaliella salina]
MAFGVVPAIKPRRFPVNQGWSTKQITLASVLLFGCVAALLSLRTLKHTALLDAHAAEIRHSGNPLAEREALVKRVAAWNINAEQNGLPLLRLEDEKVKQQEEEAEKEEEAKEQEQERREAQEEAKEKEQKQKDEAKEQEQERREAEEEAAEESQLGACDPPDPNPAYRMRPKEQLEAEYPEVADKLAKLSANNEIMLALANGVMICQNTTICWWNGGNILGSSLTIVEKVDIKNYVIGVMDDETERYLTAKGNTNWFRVKLPVPQIQEHSHPANRVSTMKYSLLQIFIQLGYNTLITDMDLVYLQNPFNHLHRDADIEVQTDGFDETAYGRLGGVNDPTMGWGGGGLYMTTFTTNVGCMWAKANARTFKLMVQVTEHLLNKGGWDQQIFNSYLMRPSHGTAFQSAYAHLRVLDIDLWVNSKIFFRSRRAKYIPGATSQAQLPVMIHMNYHPDKHKRMLCIMDRFYDNKVDACDNMPGGSEPGT